jgi:hypothetical protein
MKRNYRTEIIRRAATQSAKQEKFDLLKKLRALITNAFPSQQEFTKQLNRLQVALKGSKQAASAFNSFNIRNAGIIDDISSKVKSFMGKIPATAKFGKVLIILLMAATIYGITPQKLLASDAETVTTQIYTIVKADTPDQMFEYIARVNDRTGEVNMSGTSGGREFSQLHQKDMNWQSAYKDILAPFISETYRNVSNRTKPDAENGSFSNKQKFEQANKVLFKNFSKLFDDAKNKIYSQPSANEEDQPSYLAKINILKTSIMPDLRKLSEELATKAAWHGIPETEVQESVKSLVDQISHQTDIK